MPGSLGDLLKQAGLQPSPDAETATPERATSEAPEKPARWEARGKVVVRYTRKGHGGKTVTEITGIDTGHSLLLTQLKRELEERLISEWRSACDDGRRHTPAEYLWRVLDDPSLPAHFQIDASDSWMIAAKEMGIPVWTPGWADSTTGNMFAANVMVGKVPSHQCVISDTEQFERLLRWYLAEAPTDGSSPGIGFFQVGGGIAGDFPICAVPCLIQDMELAGRGDESAREAFAALDGMDDGTRYCWDPNVVR